MREFPGQSSDTPLTEGTWPVSSLVDLNRARSSERIARRPETVPATALTPALPRHAETAPLLPYRCPQIATRRLNTRDSIAPIGWAQRRDPLSQRSPGNPWSPADSPTDGRMPQSKRPRSGSGARHAGIDPPNRPRSNRCARRDRASGTTPCVVRGRRGGQLPSCWPRATVEAPPGS